VGHTQEGIAESIALGTRNNFDGQVAFGNGHGDAGHFLQIGDHVVKRGGQGANFIVTVNINVLVEVAGIADFARDSDEMGQGLGNGLGGVERDETARDEGEKSSARGNPNAGCAAATCGLCGFLKKFGDFRVALIKNDG